MLPRRKAVAARIVLGLVAILVATESHPQADEPNIAMEISAEPGKAESVEVVALIPQAAGVTSVESARDRARTMAQVYASTLDVLHHYYFRVNKAVLPARAMEDIFADVQDSSGAKVRWISVNARAMSVDHEPSTEFEKVAARKLATGIREVEQLVGKEYSYASAIPLHESCIQCHMGTFMTPPTKPRFAGLVISMPVQNQ